MKITPIILSIPPYLSTTWKNIASLSVKEEGNLFRLIVLLQNGAAIEVPGLNKEIIDAVFEGHAKYAAGIESSSIGFSLPLKGDSGSTDLLNSSMCHNPEHKDLPLLPPDILSKVRAIAKALGLDDLSAFPKSEPDCNCMYCQVMRSFELENGGDEELVSDADLQFKNWDIVQTSDKLYNVINPLDQNEHYNVFLGEPLGCTCGQKNCEHIRAVLSS